MSIGYLRIACPYLNDWWHGSSIIVAVKRTLAGMALLLWGLIGGCGGPETPSQGPIRALTQPTKPQPADEAFSPPSGALLTSSDVTLYLGVLRETVRLSVPRTPTTADPGAVPLSSLAGEGQGGTPDVAAARRLGIRIEQYLWIRERVLEASAAEASARLDRESQADLERAIAELEARRAVAPDDDSKKLIESQIEIFSAEASRLKKEAGVAAPESIRRNIELLRPSMPEIQTLQNQLLTDLQLIETPASSARKESQ